MRSRMLVPLVALVVCLVFVGSAWAAPSEHAFEIVPGSFSFAPSSLQAGAHSDWVTSFAFAPEGEGGLTDNDARDIIVELPAGFDASNTAVPTCTQAQLLAINLEGPSGLLANCPVSSQVGTITLEIAAAQGPPYQIISPVYNMEVTSFGTTAELGYKTVIFTGLLQIGVRPRDVGLTSSTFNIPKLGEVHKVSVTIWGIPAASEHDALRGAICGGFGEVPPVCRNEYGAPQPANIQVKPFLANPTSCGMFEAKMEADSWEEPFDWTKATDAVGPIGECERVPFEPSIEAQPSTRSAESHRSRSRARRSADVGKPVHDRYVVSEEREGHAPRRDDREPGVGGGPGRVHPRTVRCGNERLAAGGRLSAGIEDRVDQHRNAAVERIGPRLDLHRDTV